MDDPHTRTVVTHTTTTVTYHIGAGWFILAFLIIIALVATIVILLDSKKKGDSEPRFNPHCKHDLDIPMPPVKPPRQIHRMMILLTHLTVMTVGAMSAVATMVETVSNENISP